MQHFQMNSDWPAPKQGIDLGSDKWGFLNPRDADKSATLKVSTEGIRGVGRV